MDPFMDSTQVFLIRIWIEPREIDDRTIIWRGVVEIVDRQSTSIADSRSSTLPRRRYFLSLDDLLDFLIQHMEHLGIPERMLQVQARKTNS